MGVGEARAPSGPLTWHVEAYLRHTRPYLQTFPPERVDRTEDKQILRHNGVDIG